MEKLLILLAAIMLVVLGARGTYKAVWNSFFPNEQIVTTPVSTQGALSVNQPGAPAQNTSQGGQPGQTATNPNQVGQQAGTATRNQLGNAFNQLTGGSNTSSSGNTQNVVVPPGKEAVINYSGAPSWWPSWLPWPFGGGGYTGQFINAP